MAIAPERELVLQAVRELARERIAPRAQEIDETAEFPWDMVELFRENDLFGLPFDEELGGTGTGALVLLRAVEEVSKFDAAVALLLAVQELGSLAVKLFGTDEQKRFYIPRWASGEWLAAYALTEPESGSDSAAMRTSARRDGDGVRPRRAEALHHQRRRRPHVLRLRQDRHVEGPRRDLRLPRARRRSGVLGRADGAQDGDPRLDHRRPPVRELPDPGTTA